MMTALPQPIDSHKKPEFPAITLAEALDMDLSNYLIQEKSDGVHEFLEWDGHVFNSELMPDGTYVINDLIVKNSEDSRTYPTIFRWDKLQYIKPQLPRNIRIARTYESWVFARTPSPKRGYDFIRNESIRNGPSDIVVLKPSKAPFGQGWIKVKHRITRQVVIIALGGGTNSVTIADPLTGQPLGKIPLRGGKIEQVQIGSIIKISSAGQHPSGLLREAVLEPDWLVKI